jgi:hypothetical protein
MISQPETKQALSNEGYYWSESVRTTLGFQVFMHYDGSDGTLRTIQVAEIIYPRNLAWQSIEHQDPRCKLKIIIPAREFGPMAVTAMAETLSHAARLLAEENERSPRKEQIVAWLEAFEKRKQEAEERQRAHQNEMERWRAEREERRVKENEAVAEKTELIQWHLEERFRLKRRGYRSTVFGTIKAVERGYMRTLSEKNQPMTIALREIYWLEIKPEGEREYETIINEPEFKS